MPFHQNGIGTQGTRVARVFYVANVGSVAHKPRGIALPLSVT
jgi:hypothetical protein